MRFYCLCALFACAALAQDDAAQVRQSEKDWAAATMRGDIAALEKLLSDDLTYTHSSGRLETKAQFIAAVKSGSIQYQGVDYDQITVRLYGDTAIAASAPKMKVASQGQTNSFQARFLRVWAKKQGRWQLVAHQSTRLP
ncbi:MAG: nuclear transport factor 2 family protein [Acidobacteria bacterium]|nr:nuclear transport factor 2 family protein [Acidobacteriota bacterium]